jgi:signal transduction histidine kinase
MLRANSLELIILVPVVIFLLAAGVGIYFLVSKSVEDFADESIREGLASLSRAAYSEADTELDRCDIRAIDCLQGAQMLVHQLSVFERYEEFARQNKLAVIVYNPVKSSVVFDSGMANADQVAEAVGSERNSFVTNQAGDSFYTRSIAFSPWNWRVILLKNSRAFGVLVERVRNFYIGTGLVAVLIAAFLTYYLRRVIGRPINHMVERFREGQAPEYKGIREFEYLSDSVAEMMLEVSRHKANLEDLVTARTEELEDARGVLANALESISEGFSFYDANDRLVLCNDKYREIMLSPGTDDYMRPGTSFETIIRTTAEGGLIRTAHGRVEEWIAGRLQQHRNPGEFVTQQRANGRWIQINERRTESGGTVGIYTDVTEIKEAEFGLIDLKEQAERANNAKTQFLRHISHDIRSPLNAIIGFARVVKRRSEDVLDEKQIKNLEKILVSSDHLLLLVDDLLDVSKIETGKLELQPSEFSVRDLIGDCARFFEHEPKVADGSIKLINEATDDEAVVHSDQTRLKQIIVNLLSNAVKFTDAGEIRISMSDEMEKVAVTVSDTGIGIPAKETQLVFDEFHQVSDRGGKPPGGTGLGLAICRNLARLLGGDVTVQSIVGEGSTFTVTVAKRFE